MMSLWSQLTYLGERLMGTAPDPRLSQFEQDFQRAFHSDCFCSNWGTSKYYIDSHNDMYIGKGELQGTLYEAIGSKYARKLRTINFMEPVVAPVDSAHLLSEPDEIYADVKDFILAINGLDNMDTSQVRDMHAMFANDCYLREMDLSHWDTSQVVDMSFMFYHLSSLKEIHVADWDTRQVTNMRDAFNGTASLHSLNLKHWETPHVYDMSWMFAYATTLQVLDLSHFDLSHPLDTSSMFLAMRDRALIELSPQARKELASHSKGKYRKPIQDKSGQDKKQNE